MIKVNNINSVIVSCDWCCNVFQPIEYIIINSTIDYLDKILSACSKECAEGLDKKVKP